MGWATLVSSNNCTENIYLRDHILVLHLRQNLSIICSLLQLCCKVCVLIVRNRHVWAMLSIQPFVSAKPLCRSHISHEPCTNLQLYAYSIFLLPSPCTYDAAKWDAVLSSSANQQWLNAEEASAVAGALTDNPLTWQLFVTWLWETKAEIKTVTSFSCLHCSHGES
jgi:hypothetical protein